MLTFTAEQLRSAAIRVFLAAGAGDENAAIVSDHLVDANLAGHDSHGVIRIPTYVRGIKEGRIAPAAQPEVVRETAVTTLVDAHFTFGQVSSLFTVDSVVAKAREHGVAIGATFNSRHVGRLGFYPTRAAAEGVSLLVTLGNLGTAAAPFGGRAGALGTNPFSIGFPVAGEQGDGPFLLDFATTAVAYGKVMIARDKRESVPPGALQDKDGRPTTDPAALFEGGSLLPFGGHKGYALALAAALLSTALVRPGEDAVGGDSTKVFFCAIDTSVFGPGAPEAAAGIFDQVRRVPPAEDVDEVLIPGEPERRSAAKRLAEGIPVAEDTWRSIVDAAAGLGVRL
jgi:hydroxycarboxylate dehydrogenase B